jgi:hypothetical protein
MVEAIGLGKDKLCTYCWTGKCPGCKNKSFSQERKDKVGIER